MTYQILNLDTRDGLVLNTLGEAKTWAHLNCQAAEIWHKGEKIYEFDFRTLESPDVIITPRSEFSGKGNYDYMDPAQRREEKNTGTTDADQR